MLIVGITGRSGSGKSSVSSYYASLGWPVVDSDLVSRDVTAPGSACLAELVAAFGRHVLNEDGSLNRRMLAEIAFASPQKTKKLVSITHPYIVRELLARAGRAKEAGAALFFVDGAVIVGGPFEEHCDRLIVLTTEQRLAVSRIILRDGISKTAAARRLAAQQPEKALLEKADYVIENNGGEEALQRRALAVLHALEREAEKENRPPKDQ